MFISSRSIQKDRIQPKVCALPAKKSRLCKVSKFCFYCFRPLQFFYVVARSNGNKRRYFWYVCESPRGPHQGSPSARPLKFFVLFHVRRCNEIYFIHFFSWTISQFSSRYQYSMAWLVVAACFCVNIELPLASCNMKGLAGIAEQTKLQDCTTILH